MAQWRLVKNQEVLLSPVEYSSCGLLTWTEVSVTVLSGDG